MPNRGSPHRPAPDFEALCERCAGSVRSALPRGDGIPKDTKRHTDRDSQSRSASGRSDLIVHHSGVGSRSEALCLGPVRPRTMPCRGDPDNSNLDPHIARPPARHRPGNRTRRTASPYARSFHRCCPDLPSSRGTYARARRSHCVVQPTAGAVLGYALAASVLTMSRLHGQ